MYENAEIHCQKGHTAMQYIMMPLSFQYFYPSTVAEKLLIWCWTTVTCSSV